MDPKVDAERAALALEEKLGEFTKARGLDGLLHFVSVEGTDLYIQATWTKHHGYTITRNISPDVAYRTEYVEALWRDILEDFKRCPEVPGPTITDRKVYLRLVLRQHIPRWESRPLGWIVACLCGERLEGKNPADAQGRWADHVAAQIDRELRMREAGYRG